MIGQTISHYRILEKLGEGGMGVVYKAEDTKLHRSVAVKFLPLGKSTTKDQTDRFIREAQAAALLSHPNIATVFELNEVEDPSTHSTQAFIAMEYIDGKTLADLISQGLIPFDVVRDIAVQVARGLASAHEHGIIHRDIKPSNIIITNDGVAKLLDFGLARIAQESTLSQPNMIAGSVAYMSPEQVRGDKLDVRSDIWSFGVLLFQMLSGKLPFRGEHGPAMMYSISNEPAPKLAGLRNEIPENLAQLCKTCLEKDREKRPSSMKEILGILGVKEPSHYEFFSKIRRPMLLRAALSVTGALVILAVFWFGLPSLFTHEPSQQTWRIGIIPFRNLTKTAETDDWPVLIQMIMVDHLNGVAELRVVDPFSLNGLMAQSANLSLPVDYVKSGLMKDAQIEFLIDGTIQSTDSIHVLFCSIAEVSGDVKFSRSASFANERHLPAAVQDLSEQILSFFQIQTMNPDRKEDLKPWLSQRTKDFAALRAFLQGSQLAWKMKPGAAKYYRQAIALDSTFITPRTWLIAGLAGHGLLDEAKKEYQSLVHLEPSSGPFEQALIHWAGACIAMDLAGQIRALEQALEFSPRNAVLLFLIGEARYNMQNYSGAIQAFRPAVDMKWPFQPAHYFLALCYVQTKEFELATEVLERSLALESVLPQSYSLLSALSYHNRDTVSSRNRANIFLSAMRNAGASIDSAYMLLADDFQLVGLHSQAAHYLRESLRGNARIPLYHFKLGTALFESGELDSAQRELSIALNLDPNLADTHRMLGKTFDFKNDIPNALFHYEKYLQHDSTSSNAMEVRLRVERLKR